MRIIPLEELEISFVRASGKGGQNVNKVSSKAQLKWNISHSSVFTAEEKMLIKRRLSRRINDAGEVVLSAQEERSQLQNKRRVVEKLHHVVQEALTPCLKRIPTKPTRSSRRKRVQSKIQHSRKKATVTFLAPAHLEFQAREPVF